MEAEEQIRRLADYEGSWWAGRRITSPDVSKSDISAVGFWARLSVAQVQKQNVTGLT